MTVQMTLLLLAGTLCAASGQLMFKIGATGREQLLSFVNAWVISGLIAYGVSTLLWIYALSKIKLTVVYPFTALTFVLVYLFGIFVLHEPTTAKALIGVTLVLGGLFMISTA